MSEQEQHIPENESPSNGDVVPVYANNVRFEMSAWDLRMFFGQLEPGAQNIDWHTDVSVAWAQAKLMHLYLGINLAIYELENGPIKVPSRVIPPPMTSPPQDLDESNPLSQATFQLVQKMLNEFRDREGKRP